MGPVCAHDGSRGVGLLVGVVLRYVAFNYQ